MGVLVAGDVCGLGSLINDNVDYYGTVRSETSQVIVWSRDAVRNASRTIPLLSQNALQVALAYIDISSNASCGSCRCGGTAAGRHAHPPGHALRQHDAGRHRRHRDQRTAGLALRRQPVHDEPRHANWSRSGAIKGAAACASRVRKNCSPSNSRLIARAQRHTAPGAAMLESCVTDKYRNREHSRQTQSDRRRR
jgi:hypothetical protein